jgi:zinc protease
MRELAFASHPYASTPPGEPEDLDKVTVDELRKMYDTYYVPNNAVLVIVGDATTDEVKALVEKRFKDVPAGKGTPPTAKRGEAIPPPAKPIAEELGRAEVGFLARASHLPPMKSDDIFALRVLAGILGGEGQGARLPALVLSRQAGDYATAQVDTHQDGGLFMMMAEYVDPTKRDVLVGLFDDEVKRLMDSGVTPDELERGKNQLAAILAGSLEDTTGMAFHAGSSKVLRGDAKAWLDDHAKYLAVTNEDIIRVAKKYLGGEKATLVVMTPGGRR